VVSKSAVRAVAFDGGRLVTGSDEGKVTFWSTIDSVLTKTTTMRDAHRAVRGAAIISDGIAVTGGSEGILRTWDVTSGKEVGPRLDRTLLGGIRTVTAVGDGTVAAGTEAGTIVLWNPASGDVGEIIGHRGRVWAASAFGDGRLATVAFDRTLRIWNLGSGAELARAADPLGASWGLACIDGEHLAAASPIGVIRVAKVVDLSVAGSAHLTSAAVSLCVTTSGDRTYVVVGGDASKPTFLVLDLLRLQPYVASAHEAAGRSDFRTC